MAKYDIFTPENIVFQMQKYLPNTGLCLEPSVGEGALIKGLKGEIDVFDICNEYLKKIPASSKITKTLGNFLTTEILKKYPRIISNPPFQKYQDIPEDLRTVIRSIHPCLTTGNIDMYVAFLVKCLSLLDESGTFVAICPSTWIYNVSCRAFREYLYTNKYIKLIYDFGSEKVFPDVGVYCSIVVFTKIEKTYFTYNTRKINYGMTLSPLSMIHLDTGKDTLNSIADIQNGLATLCDKVFIHREKLYDEKCWTRVLKVSKHSYLWAILPYSPEKTFELENPKTFAFLEMNKELLSKRDRGKKTYETWYSYGRKQGLKIPDIPESIYISTLCNPDISKSISIQKTGLFYSGIRITPKDGVSCETIRDILLRTDFTERCSKRANNWLNVTVSILKSITV
jgi:hypothetical protein